MLRVAYVLVLMVLGSCATYYQSNFVFNQEFEHGDLDKALKTLQAHTAEAHGKREFLYFVNNGLVLSMMGKYDESNDYFEKAYIFGEDYRTNYLNEAASFLTNPNFTSYKGEDHEHLMVLYYKSVNYLKMGKTDEALVECRRLITRLQQLSDRYRSSDKYKEDAFIHVLMGIIYEVDKDFNNAFIAYRNAVNVYENDYQRLFQLGTPQQLKLDFLRTAWQSGMKDDFENYKSKWGMQDYVYQAIKGGEVVFFWHDGLSPVKVEWGINFVISRAGNTLIFSNSETGLSFPFQIGGYNESIVKGLTDLQLFRVVFPRYLERPAFYKNATIEVNGSSLSLQLLEDVNAIAFKCLHERMAEEFSKALIRLATKKVLEMEARKEDKTFGAVVGIFNTLTEKADTRNWQTLPHSIYYTRIPLPTGKSSVKFNMLGMNGVEQEHDFNYDLKQGQIHFHTFTSLESGLPNYGYN